jgi:hypothetical protein
MIYKAPFLPYDKIRSYADQFLEKYHPTKTIPIPIEEIAEFKLKLDIIPMTDLKSTFDIEGWLSNDLCSIYVDQWIQDNRENRYCFTLAHEIGHLMLHGDLYQQAKFSNVEEWFELQQSIDSDQYSWFEKQAYDFAGLILVPRESLLTQYGKALQVLESQSYQFKKANVDIINEYISVFVSKAFKVSDVVAKKRIDYDGLTPFVV